MTIGPLIQSAFVGSPDFNNQVNAIVVRQALYKVDTMPDLSDGSRQEIARLVRSPASYGFASSMIAKSTWSISYDIWAADPAAQDGAIQAQVDSLWDLLVGPIVTNPPP